MLAMELARDRLLPTELTRATLLAEVYDPERAAKVGYLDATAAPDAVLELAKAEATRLAGYAPSAFLATKVRLRGKSIAYIEAGLADDVKSLLMPTA
jgi:enoyl-CoA hydratase/carnithine racemase